MEYQQQPQETDGYPPSQQFHPQYEQTQQPVQYYPVSSHTEHYPTGCNLESIQRVVTSPDGVLRLFELLFAIVSFGAMADEPNYTVASEFKFLVAAGVLTFLWTLVMLTFYVFDLASSAPLIFVVEMVGDFVLIVFEFAAGVASAHKCNESIPGTSGQSKPKAAAAFAFLLFFALLGSLFFGYKKWQAHHASK